MQKIVVLGSTGSIGLNTLQVVRDHPREFEVVGLAAGRQLEALAGQVRAFRPRAVAVREEAGAAELKRMLNGFPTEILAGEEGVAALAGMDGADRVVVAITGAAALKPVLAALRRKRTVGLANKETLVIAGELVMREAREHGARILPIDSEHSAIFQCLEGRPAEEVRRILLTTSGGPLRTVPVEEFGRLTKSQIMDHPRWKMGPKITVDSATMMNKALEVIEARWLFGLGVEKVEVVVHPEAIVHSMVEFIDGSVLAQLAVTDMRLPIQYALSHPKRLPSGLPALDLVGLKQLTFESPDVRKFPCLEFGFEAARAGGTLPAVLNAANEVCVEAFLRDALPFTRIPPVIGEILRRHRPVARPSLEDILQADAWARAQVTEWIGDSPKGDTLRRRVSPFGLSPSS